MINLKLQKVNAKNIIFPRKLTEQEKRHISELEEFIDENLTAAFGKNYVRKRVRIQMPHGYFQHIVQLLPKIYNENGWKTKYSYDSHNETYISFSRKLKGGEM